jgi:hypothetical protein
MIVPPTDAEPVQQAQVETTSRLVVATGLFPSGSLDPNIEIMDLDEEAWIEFQTAPHGYKYLAEDGTLTVVPPPPPPVVYAAQQDVDSQVRTTNATPLEVFRFACSPKHIYRANLRISGVDAGNGACKVMEGRFVWKCLTTTAIVVGIEVVSDIHDTAAASWAPNCVASGADVVFTVTGVAGRNIDWLLVGEVGRFAPEGLV